MQSREGRKREGANRPASRTPNKRLAEHLSHWFAQSFVVLSTIGPEDQIRKGARKSLEHQETSSGVDVESNA
jgi:hypothetical protein